MARYSVDPDEIYIQTQSANITIGSSGRVFIDIIGGPSDEVVIPREVFEVLFSSKNDPRNSVGETPLDTPTIKEKNEHFKDFFRLETSTTPHSCPLTDPANKGKGMLYYCPVCSGGGTLC